MGKILSRCGIIINQAQLCIYMLVYRACKQRCTRCARVVNCILQSLDDPKWSNPKWRDDRSHFFFGWSGSYTISFSFPSKFLFPRKSINGGSGCIEVVEMDPTQIDSFNLCWPIYTIQFWQFILKSKRYLTVYT